MKVIFSPSGFEYWAKKEYGDDWYNNRDIIKVYSKEQLSALYGFEYPQDIKDFKKTDVDMYCANLRAKEEYELILNSKNRYKDNRTDEKIYEHTLQGHIAEQYLIDAYKMQNCNIKYHDLIDNNGKIVEVKTSKNPSNLDIQFERIKSAKWNKSDRMIAFIINGDSYELYFDKEIN